MQNDRAPRLILGILLATSIWATVFVLQSDFSGYYEICKPSQTGQKECATYHVIFFALIKLVEFFNDIANLITALSTVVIAWFTITLARSTHLMWKASEKQIVIAQDAAVAAAASAQVATISARAWVGFDSALLAPIINRETGEKILRVKINFKNYGSSPAIEFAMACADPIIVESGSPKDFSIRKPPKEGTIPSSHLGATKVGSTPDIYIPRNIVERAEHREIDIFIAAFAEYRDVINNAEQRDTEVCLQLVIVAPPFGSHPRPPNDRVHWRVHYSRMT